MEIQSLFLKLLESPEKDIILLLATANTFRRVDKLEIIPLLIKTALQLNVNIRILADIDSLIEQILEKYGNNFDQINFHTLSKTNRPFIIILIIDESLSLVIDIKDDRQEIFKDSLGIGTFSNIESTIDTYISLFEREWIQTQLQGQNND